MSAVLCLTLFMMLLDGSKLYSEATHGHDHGHGHGHEHGQCRDKDQGVQEQKVNVDGVDINYVRTGTGDHPVLLLPGAMGWSWYNFGPQIEGLDKNKFTIIAWDPPGYGKSRPPSRTYPVNLYARDASWARNLMKTLGFERFSLVGWSEGGVTALTLAGDYPQNVRKLIATSAQAYMTSQEKDILKLFRNIDTLPAALRDPLVAYYGEDYFRTMWANYVDGLENIYVQRNGSLCKETLPKITAPTLIVHGRNDTGVPLYHPIYLKDNIRGARLKIMENATHPVQLEYPQEFNAIVTNFLTEGIVT
ncbi:valacyclovir hydrolase-like [Hylaeus volcanicus]|uniref:valacyclovir hydrolase-like n=1 Tax=Hylaeus volcanicus TaxID=313075 RepID=UPI0023B7E279|nr:valacyclovir hydrolase-like [Hylaeus volcanicus]